MTRRRVRSQFFLNFVANYTLTAFGGRSTATHLAQTPPWWPNFRLFVAVPRMVKRRAAKAGITTAIGNHSFRGTGITNYLENGGSLSEAQRMAGHADPRTTRLYDRRDQKITRGEVEKITILG